MGTVVIKRGFCGILAVFLLLHLWKGENRAKPAFLPARISGATLIIDAGHGGEDGGAVSLSGAIESHINLEIALRIGALLDLYGVDHILLRDSDRSLHNADCVTLREKKISDLHNRAATVESIPNGIFMSIHQNTFTDSRYHGAQVFYGKNAESLSFAQQIQTGLKEGLDPGNTRVPTPVSTSVYLMNHITCPAILVECGFLSNPSEDTLLQTPTYQTKLALVLSSAYLAYQNSTKEEPFYENT